MLTKFTLIGLPGVGKSTVSQECLRILRDHGLVCDTKSTDAIIRDRFKADDPIITQFEQKIGKIPSDIFNAEKPIGAFIEKFGEEPLFRDLEELFIKDILQSFYKNDWLDIGGKAPLRDLTINTLRHKQIVPVFLYASHEIIIDRLEQDNNWQKRNNYLNAGEEYWKKLAHTHRSERLLKYFEAASIIISVDVFPEEKHHPDLKTPQELAREIFYRIKELKLTCTSPHRNNSFTKRNRLFFSPYYGKHLTVTAFFEGDDSISSQGLLQTIK